MKSTFKKTITGLCLLMSTYSFSCEKKEEAEFRSTTDCLAYINTQLKNHDELLMGFDRFANSNSFNDQLMKFDGKKAVANDLHLEIKKFYAHIKAIVNTHKLNLDELAPHFERFMTARRIFETQLEKAHSDNAEAEYSKAFWMLPGVLDKANDYALHVIHQLQAQQTPLGQFNAIQRKFNSSNLSDIDIRRLLVITNQLAEQVLNKKDIEDELSAFQLLTPIVHDRMLNKQDNTYYVGLHISVMNSILSRESEPSVKRTNVQKEEKKNK